MNSHVDFIDNLKLANGNERKHQALVAELSKFGISMAKYGFSIFGGDEPDVSFVGGYGSDLEALVERENLHQNDVTIRHCMLRTEPILWSEVIGSAQQGELSNAERRTHHTLADLGLTNGLVLPLRDSMVFGRGGIGLHGDGQENSQTFYSRMAQQIPMIRAACECFHASLDRQMLHTSPHSLSPREIECLKWLSQGLRPQQIGDRLGISDRTVGHQIASARRKLRTATREQAVAKAIIIGVFEP